MDQSAVPTPSRDQLLDHFAALNIKAQVVPYPAHKTVEEGKLLRGSMTGTFTKNLLLKDKKGRLYLLAVDEDRMLDLKAVPPKIGAKGHLSFASAEAMSLLLGVTPGALTPLGIIHDKEGLVTVVLDACLMGADQINFHPLVQTESIGLPPSKLLEFIRSCGREPLVVDFDN